MDKYAQGLKRLGAFIFQRKKAGTNPAFSLVIEPTLVFERPELVRVSPVVSKQRFVVMKSKEAEEYKGFETENPVTDAYIKHYIRTGKNFIFEVVFKAMFEHLDGEDLTYWVSKAIGDGELYSYDVPNVGKKLCITPKIIKLLKVSITMSNRFSELAEIYGQTKLRPLKLSKFNKKILILLSNDTGITDTKNIARRLHAKTSKVSDYLLRLKKARYVKKINDMMWALTDLGDAAIPLFVEAKKEKLEVLRPLDQ